MIDGGKIKLRCIFQEMIEGDENPSDECDSIVAHYKRVVEIAETKNINELELEHCFN